MIYVAQVDGLVTSLGGNGPAWTLVAILLALCWLLIRMLLAEKDKRIEDAVKNRDELAAPMKSIGESLERVEKKIRIAKGEE